MRFRVEYHQPAELLADHEQQFVHGGLLVRGEPPPGLALFQQAELEIVAGSAVIVLAAQVVQILPGLGVALTFAANDPRLAEVVAQAEQGALPAAPEPDATPPIPARPGGGHTSPAAKIQLALHGTRDDRAAILRDINKQIHPYVLKNPNLQLDEIAAMAKMTAVSPDLLRQICERREWVQRPEIAGALIRNPKLPAPMAVRLIDYISPAELRQLAKDTRIREPIARAARKKLLGE